MTPAASRKDRSDAIRARFRAPLLRLAAERQRVEADIHCLYGIDRSGRGRTRLRLRRSAIRVTVAWRSVLAALVPGLAARFQVAFRPSRDVAGGARDQLARPLRLAACLLPAASRDRWTEEWRGELAVLSGRRRLRWMLSTIRGLIAQAYILRRVARRRAA